MTCNIVSTLPAFQAVCCSDQLHCCPSGTQCDLTVSVCVAGGPVPAAEITAAVGAGPMAPKGSGPDSRRCCLWLCFINGGCGPSSHDSTGETRAPVPIRTDNDKCDESTSCPGDSTCCKTLKGGWACCPLAQVMSGWAGPDCSPLLILDENCRPIWVWTRLFQAVCCDDHVHCCPHDTVCNLEAQTCDSQSGGGPPLRWVEKAPALTSEAPDEQCDEHTTCPGDSTCCKMASGQWACCPLPEVSAGGASLFRSWGDLG